jgi:putative membrane protein
MTYERLAKLSGTQFDREYVKIMIQDHDKIVAEFEEASPKVKDPSLKAFVEKTLPILRQPKEHVHGLL